MAGASDLGEASKVRIDALATQLAQRLNRLLDAVDGKIVYQPPEPLVEWRMFAACAFTYNSAMKGEEPMSQHRLNQKALKKLCAGCPVTHECMTFAHRAKVKEGVWGGKVWGPKHQW